MDEYISREEAIKELREAYENEYPTASGDFDEYASHDVPNVLRNIPSADVQPVDRWISVKDRLPEGAEPCVVVTENNGLGVSRLIGRNELEWTLLGESVLYWMSLPEPPKDGDAE